MLKDMEMVEELQETIWKNAQIKCCANTNEI